MAKENLTLKNIREFTSDDTLYIRPRSASNSIALCRFIRFEKGKVTVMPLEGKPEEVTVDVERCALYGQLEGENRTSYHWFDPIGHAAYANAETRHMAVPTKHPSYAMISVSKRTSGGSTALFGSSILHHNSISLKISPAELIRDLHEDRFHARNLPLIEVEMTPQQFTDMLTSPNTEGTPVTLRYLGGDQVEACPFISKIEQFDMELDAKIKNTHADTKQKMANLLHIIQESKLPVKDKEYIARAINSINMGVESNLPFLQSQVAEGMNKVVGEAKAAISAYFHQEAKALGITAPTQMIGLD